MAVQIVTAGPVPSTLPAAEEQELRALVTPLISDNLDRLAGIVGLNRYNGKGKIVGTAITIKTRPGDNLGMYQAMTMMQPGHVLVVDGGGDLNNALCGDLMRAYAVARGCAGFVIDGAIRDVTTFAAGDFPCYARGVVHRGPYKSGPAHINVPVCIGGQVVNPGDVVVGDEDGLVVFAPEQVRYVVEKANAKLRQEQAIMAEIEAGAPRQEWLHGMIESFGIKPHVTELSAPQQHRS
ncbi:RraA family protein [Methylobacterium nodulans]|uniref:Putative 4-hydroxy-4-methyl-2-oxoglutarate aldolase n=1 Tax=Methylobacterium nodulans (strain LMG 21967 / CNCM I-2342 / ORS 2060) TaxID=460265 RepID=B8IWB0_METNO|nr:RraA family protein [Methylobacterium nodulans]ACL62700.1 Dimethylmenaquinone methyltransferase [Methylobacterium nodulans ORS 2060]